MTKLIYSQFCTKALFAIHRFLRNSVSSATWSIDYASNNSTYAIFWRVPIFYRLTFDHDDVETGLNFPTYLVVRRLIKYGSQLLLLPVFQFSELERNNFPLLSIVIEPVFVTSSWRLPTNGIYSNVIHEYDNDNYNYNANDYAE